MQTLAKWFLLLIVCGLLGCGDTNITVNQDECKNDSECKKTHACQEEEGVKKCIRADNDGDTWAKGKDCDDSNPLVYPGAPEICDNKADDNCNGKTDEEPCICKDGEQRECGPKNVGICKAGRQLCKAGRWGDCQGSVDATTEDCNGQDDDCDGQVDEDIKGECYTGADGTRDRGKCKAGTRTCEKGKWSECKGEITPADKEACNGEDDDCDGIIDNGLEQDCYDGPDGTKGRGECKAGVQVCLAGKWSKCNGVVKPTPEDCDGKDNDCNGKVDEGLVSSKCYNGPAGTQGVGECRDGVRKCDGGAWTKCTGEIVPAAQETCKNNKDDNCNGQVDENCTTLFTVTTSINTDTGVIDGIKRHNEWKGSGKFQLPNLQIPKGSRVVVTGMNPLTLTVQGPVVIDGTLDLAGKPGGSSNCQNNNPGVPGKGGGGGGSPGGVGGEFNVATKTCTNGRDGQGAGKGGGGRQGASKGGGGGGGGAAANGKVGLPSGFGGKAGLAYGSATTISPGSGGGGGACGVVTSIFGPTATPGSCGGGGGGATQIESTVGDVTVNGNIIANGGDGGVAPECASLLDPNVKATGGSGGGGSGGSILLRAKGNIIIGNSAYLTAHGGKGTGIAKGGDGSDGRIRFQDGDGKVTFPSARVTPAPTLAKY